MMDSCSRKASHVLASCRTLPAATEGSADLTDA